MRFNEKTWKKYLSSINVKSKPNKENLKNSIIKAIEKNIPKEKFGIMFSGGVDSTLLALICKKLKKDFVCYTVGLEDADDIKWAKKTAKQLKFKLKIKIITSKEMEKILEKVIKLVGTNAVRVSIASVFYVAMQLAKKDKIKYLFSGLGSEELFGGYERHKVKDINKACWEGLGEMYNRDLSRDYAVADNFNIKLLLPFLDKEIIENAMAFSGKDKINKDFKKIILRKIAEELKVPKEVAWRKKKAAQYGSKFDKAIERLSKKNKFKYKSDYLKSLI